MKIQKITFGILLAWAVINTVRGQQFRTEKDLKKINMISKDFGVDERKATEIYDAFLFNTDKMAILFKNSSVSQEDKMKQMKKLTDERQQRINSLLTPDQLNISRKLEQREADRARSALDIREKRQQEQMGKITGGHVRDTSKRQPRVSFRN